MTRETTINVTLKQEGNHTCGVIVLGALGDSVSVCTHYGDELRGLDVTLDREEWEAFKTAVNHFDALLTNAHDSDQP